MAAAAPTSVLAFANGIEPGRALLAPNGTVLAADASLAAALGSQPEALVGTLFAGLLPPTTPALGPLLASALERGDTLTLVDLQLSSVEGETPTRLLLSLAPLRSRLGVVLGADLELRPWAAGRMAELKLPPDAAASIATLRSEFRDSDEPYRALFDQADSGLILVGPKGGLVRVNPGFCALVGFSPDELMTMHPDDLSHPDDLDADREQLRQLMNGEAASRIEKRFLRRDGSYVWTRTSRSLVRGPGGEVRFGLVMVQDISAEKQLQETLERSESLMRRLWEHTVFGVMLGDTDGRIVYANPAFAHMLGYSVEELSDGSRRWQELTAPGAGERDAAAMAELRRTGACAPYEKAFLARDGRVVPVLIGAAMIHRAGREQTVAAAFVTDLSAVKAAEAERAVLLRSAEQTRRAADEALAMLDAVVESAPIGIAYVDLEFRYQRVNAVLARMNGVPAAAHIGKRANELFPQFAPFWEPHWRRVIDTGEPVQDLVLSATMPDGSVRHALVTFFPVRVGEGPVLGVGILVADITAQRQAEEERLRLLEREREALADAQAAQARAEEAVQLRDGFLSIAAHELKTPLTSLLGQAQLLERRLAREGQLTELNARSLQVVVGQTRRLSHLIGDLLDGAHLELGQLVIRQRPTELRRLVAQAVEELQPTVPSHSIIAQLPPGAVLVQADPVRIEQVVQNLLSNAVKYSSRGSTVRVELRQTGDTALLAVHDEGVGIPAEAIPHLFERFYRVNQPETASVSGVGVGLYVVREIVRLHGGAVRVQSTPGVGSSFTVELPLAPVLEPGGA
jgi:PAS domain S-box-containing protein